MDEVSCHHHLNKGPCGNDSREPRRHGPLRNRPWLPLSDPAYGDWRVVPFRISLCHAEFPRKGPEEITTFFDTDTFGLGYAHSLNTAEEVGLRYRVLLLTTPTTPESVDFTIATSVQRPDSGDQIAGVAAEEVAELMHRGALGGVKQDVPIWEGLRYINDPRLVKETDRSPASVTGHDSSTQQEPGQSRRQ